MVAVGVVVAVGGVVAVVVGGVVAVAVGVVVAVGVAMNLKLNEGEGLALIQAISLAVPSITDPSCLEHLARIAYKLGSHEVRDEAYHAIESLLKKG